MGAGRDAGAKAREYLEQRGLPAEAIEQSGLGVVPEPRAAADCLRSSGYSDREIVQSGVMGDSRWPGRLCGAWRDERGRIKTLWARSLDASTDDTRYLYLRGVGRANLPPYGLSWVLKETPRPHDLVLVEGLMDVHHLRARRSRMSSRSEERQFDQRPSTCSLDVASRPSPSASIVMMRDESRLRRRSSVPRA